MRKLSEDEVQEKLAMVESKRQKLLRAKQMKGSRRAEKQNKQIQLAKQMMEQKMKRKVEQQGSCEGDNVLCYKSRKTWVVACRRLRIFSSFHIICQKITRIFLIFNKVQGSLTGIWIYYMYLKKKIWFLLTY